ncbi:MAG: flagellin [Terracidiphilus sp.]|jgi:flagellin
MALTVLNNISSMTAENALSNTQANLQKTLTQLSTGMKINSGSDDAAGLSIVSGLNANIAALTQSQQNASNGIGLLQTADGALSQVTTLLNRAVTLATEGSTTGITSSQSTALDTEFQSILSEINQIGQATNFNGSNVFSSNAPTTFSSTQGSVGSPLLTTTALTANSVTKITDSATGGTFVFTAAAGDKISDLQTAITNAVTAGTLSAGTTATIVGGKLTIADAASNGVTVSSNDAVLGPMVAATTNDTSTVYLGDGTTTGATNTEITTTINALSATALNLNADVLTSSASSITALGDVTAAINTISAQRGVIGASVNRLTAASSNMANQVTNLQSAANGLQNADIGKTVANMTQYNVLQSTGMAALQQSNQAQQAVLKLVQ